MKTYACETCKFVRKTKAPYPEDMLQCHRYPPSMTADGPLVIKNPRDLPQEIPMDPYMAIPVFESGGIHRIPVQGFPLVGRGDWCGEHEDA